MDASAFGDLQRTNLQLVLRVNRVTRTHTITTEEDVMKQPVRGKLATYSTQACPGTVPTCMQHNRTYAVQTAPTVGHLQ